MIPPFVRRVSGGGRLLPHIHLYFQSVGQSALKESPCVCMLSISVIISVIVLTLTWVSGKGTAIFLPELPSGFFICIFHFIYLFPCILHGLFSPARALVLAIHTGAGISLKSALHGADALLWVSSAWIPSFGALYKGLVLFATLVNGCGC